MYMLAAFILSWLVAFESCTFSGHNKHDKTPISIQGTAHLHFPSFEYNSHAIDTLHRGMYKAFLPQKLDLIQTLTCTHTHTHPLSV